MRTLTDHIVEGDSANHQLTITVTDSPGSGGANHRYEITGFDTTTNTSDDSLGRVLTGVISNVVLFQNGPIKEFGVNGVTGEALTAIQIDRMRSFQAGPFACADNAEALLHFEAALECLQRRTRARIARGVEGTHLEMPENNKVDITPLIGRRFVAKSNNRVRVTRLEEGAVSYMWARLPSDSDMAEAEAWAADITGPVNVTRNVGIATEADALEKWRNG
jgi:hypothetical protein